MVGSGDAGGVDQDGDGAERCLGLPVGFQVLAFGLPILLLAWALLSGSALAWLLALVSQAAGLLAERWFFFAQARHPQNIYYQAVS